MLSIFSYVSGPSVCLPWRSVCSSPLPIFYLGCLSSQWGCVSYLYILKIKPLSKVSLANIFSHTVGFLFILVLFLLVKKLFILMKSHLFILSFISLDLGDVSVRMLLCGMSEIFLPIFTYRTFMVLQLIFKSFIHLEFIFVCGVCWWSSFIFFLHVAVQISQHHLQKRLILLHFILLPPLSNINWP